MSLDNKVSVMKSSLASLDAQIQSLEKDEAVLKNMEKEIRDQVPGSENMTLDQLVAYLQNSVTEQEAAIYKIIEEYESSPVLA